MSRQIGARIGLTLALGLIAVQPVLADEATAAFLANIDRATATVNQMQALFTRMDQRRQAQAAGAASAAPAGAPGAPGAPAPGAGAGNTAPKDQSR